MMLHLHMTQQDLEKTNQTTKKKDPVQKNIDLMLSLALQKTLFRQRHHHYTKQRTPHLQEGEQENTEMKLKQNHQPSKSPLGL